MVGAVAAQTTTPLVSQLVYVSRSAAHVDRSELEAILDAARPYNAAHDITGFLTFDGTSFVQLLEGPPDAVDALMGRIEADARHDGVRRIWSVMGHRLLPRWAMHHEHFDRAHPFVQEQVRVLLDRRGEHGVTRRQIQQLVLRLKLESVAPR